MIDVLRIRLEARCSERGLQRCYEIEVGRDLLGAWCVTVRHGRIGSPLRHIHFSNTDETAARRLLAERLRRRLSAPRRIGCSYVVVEAESRMSDWPIPPGGKLFVESR